MKVGLNLLGAHPKITGGWSYLHNLLKAVRDIDKTTEYTAYCTAASRELLQDWGHIGIRICPVSSTNQFLRIAYENSVLQYYARRDHLDLMHWFGNTQSVFAAVPAAVTVYDLLALERPASTDPLKRLYFRILVARGVRRGAAILPISAATGVTIQKHFQVEPERMTVLPCPLGPEWRRASAEDCSRFKTKHHLPEKFWLYVANFYPHKNHDRLIEAYAMLLNKNPHSWPLVLRGNGERRAVIEAIAQRLGIHDRVVFLPPVEEEEMPLLFSAATALIYPSLFEGLGIPLMEALACGCPAAASDIPTSTEVGGNAVRRFDPEDTGSIERAMEEFQSTPTLRDQCVQLGELRVDAFRNKTVVANLLRTYQRIVGIRNGVRNSQVY